jgi:hypothetical protein
MRVNKPSRLLDVLSYASAIFAIEIVLADIAHLIEYPRTHYFGTSTFALFVLPMCVLLLAILGIYRSWRSGSTSPQARLRNIVAVALIVLHAMLFTAATPLRPGDSGANGGGPPVHTSSPEQE